MQTENRDRFIEGLRSKGIETRLVNRLEYNEDVVSWADVVFAAGGDGTFLMAAAKINDSSKPLIGINTDPDRSVGHLCIPSKYTSNIDAAITKILKGDFRWMHRQRIRVTIVQDEDLDEPLEIHNQMLGKFRPEYRFLDLDEGCVRSRTNSCDATGRSPETKGFHPSSRRHVIPHLALNEVFVGESLSSRVSYCEMQFNRDPSFKIRSSGITICTGTGSTSWSFNINKLTPSCVLSVVKIIEDETGKEIGQDVNFVKRVTDKFNDSLIFSPSEKKMGYTIRDPIVFKTEFNGSPRGFADSIKIKSRMTDASLVLDGGLSYKFNDGSSAIFEILQEDALKTIDMQ